MNAIREKPGRLKVWLASLAAVALPGSVPRVLIEADHAQELERNQQLRVAEPDVQEQHKRRLRGATEERARLLRLKTVKSFALMAAAVAAGWLYEQFAPDSLRGHTALYTVLSTFAFAWGTVGRLGWEGQSMSGNTAIERFDAFILRALYWLGMFFATIAVL